MITLYEHMLVPIDFEETSMKALDAAIRLARRTEAKVTIVHVCEPPSTTYSETLFWPTENVEREAKKALDAATRDAKSRYARVESVLVTGKPWERILDVAQEREADLIVMGTHGRRGVARLLIGSVAEKVVRMSPVPVMTVPVKAAEEK